VNASTSDVTVAARRPGARIVALYPRAWRVRYGDELEDLLESGSVGLRGRLDLVRGALDAHLHPERRSPLPVVAALTASALATAHALALVAQPVPLDWPGYLEDGLPMIIGAVAALLPTSVGLWLKLGDADGRLGRAGLLLSVAGHGAWLVALLAAALRLEYGPITAIAATFAMAGTAALGVALVGRGRFILGVLLAAAALAGIAPPGIGWPLFALAWTGVALALLVEFVTGSREGDAPTDGGPIRA
jgi:hypothetical protein